MPSAKKMPPPPPSSPPPAATPKNRPRPPPDRVDGDAYVALMIERERQGNCAECAVQTHEFVTGPDGGKPRLRPLTIEGEVHRGRCLFCRPFVVVGRDERPGAAASVAPSASALASASPAAAPSVDGPRETRNDPDVILLSAAPSATSQRQRESSAETAPAAATPAAAAASAASAVSALDAPRLSGEGAASGNDGGMSHADAQARKPKPPNQDQTKMLAAAERDGNNERAAVGEPPHAEQENGKHQSERVELLQPRRGGHRRVRSAPELNVEITTPPSAERAANVQRGFPSEGERKVSVERKTGNAPPPSIPDERQDADNSEVLAQKEETKQPPETTSLNILRRSTRKAAVSAPEQTLQVEGSVSAPRLSSERSSEPSGTATAQQQREGTAPKSKDSSLVSADAQQSPRARQARSQGETTSGVRSRRGTSPSKPRQEGASSASPKDGNAEEKKRRGGGGRRPSKKVQARSPAKKTRIADVEPPADDADLSVGAMVDAPRPKRGRKRKTSDSTSTTGLARPQHHRRRTGKPNSGRSSSSADTVADVKSSADKPQSTGQPSSQEDANSGKTKPANHRTSAIEKTIKRALERPHTVSVQLSALETLTKLAVDARQSSAIIEHGGAKVIIKAMQEHRQKNQVQSMACEALATIAYHDNIAKIYAAGGLIESLKAMRRHCNSGVVHYQAIGALQQIANYEPAKDDIVSEGALDAVIKSMKTFQSATLQDQACLFIQDLAFQANDEVISHIVSSGAIDGISAAMKKHASFPPVQESACGALHNMARDDEIKAKIVDAGVAKSIYLAMKTHFSADLQELACKALNNLATEYADVNTKIVDIGCLSVTVTAMESFPDAAGLQTAACNLLQNLAYNDDYATKIALEGGTMAIVACMERHANNVEVQRAACAALRNVDHPSDKSTERTASVIIKALKNHKYDCEVQTEGCWALWQYADFDDVFTLLKNRETNKILLRAKKTFPSECSRLVDDISSWTDRKDGKEKIRKTGHV